MKKLNWRVVFVIGLAAGILQALAGVVMYVAGVYFAWWSMLVSGLVLLLCIILGTRWYRNNMLGGTMTYGQAVILGIVISVSTGVIYALYNVITISFIYPHFLDDMIRNGVAHIQESGLSSEQTSELVASMKRNATVPIPALGNLIRLSIVGTAFSTITSIILRRKDSSY
jgi:ethanolamine transporter EutH